MTKLRDILDPSDLHEACAKGLVRMQRHPDFENLLIFNYTEACAWDRAWTPTTLECRGLIVEAGEEPMVLARPYRKFFNHDEGQHDESGATGPVEVTDKMDGSLGIGYKYGDRWRVATRGSFASDQAVWASNWLSKNVPLFSAPIGWTPLWEIIYPGNRIVVNYGGYEGLVLLGWRHKGTGALAGPLDFGGNWQHARTEVMPYDSLDEVLRSEPRSNAEGMVVRWFGSGLQLKYKQEDYKRLHAVVTNTTNRTVWQALSTGTEIDLAGVPDEFRTWVTVTMADLKLQYMKLTNAVIAQHAMVLAQLPTQTATRKSYALKAKDHPYAPAMFKLLDGKPIRDWVWAQLKPATIERPFQES